MHPIMFFAALTTVTADIQPDALFEIQKLQSQHEDLLKEIVYNLKNRNMNQLQTYGQLIKIINSDKMMLNVICEKYIDHEIDNPEIYDKAKEIIGEIDEVYEMENATSLRKVKKIKDILFQVGQFNHDLALEGVNTFHEIYSKLFPLVLPTIDTPYRQFYFRRIAVAEREREMRARYRNRWVGYYQPQSYTHVDDKSDEEGSAGEGTANPMRSWRRARYGYRPYGYTGYRGFRDDDSEATSLEEGEVRPRDYYKGRDLQNMSPQELGFRPRRYGQSQYIDTPNSYSGEDKKKVKGQGLKGYMAFMKMNEVIHGRRRVTIPMKKVKNASKVESSPKTTMPTTLRSTARRSVLKIDLNDMSDESSSDVSESLRERNEDYGGDGQQETTDPFAYRRDEYGFIRRRYDHGYGAGRVLSGAYRYNRGLNVDSFGHPRRDSRFRRRSRYSRRELGVFRPYIPGQNQDGGQNRTAERHYGYAEFKLHSGRSDVSYKK
uniref:Uncharacterized protein n=1 Tax=Clastoptera arizonana TaxID=38151 RepID=A0A1B6E2I0_9HEMI